MGQHKSKFSLLPALRLLNTESQDEYDRLSNAIAKSIKPRDALEEIWVADIIYFEWMHPSATTWRSRCHPHGTQ